MGRAVELLIGKRAHRRSCGAPVLAQQIHCLLFHAGALPASALRIQLGDGFPGDFGDGTASRYGPCQVNRNCVNGCEVLNRFSCAADARPEDQPSPAGYPLFEQAARAFRRELIGVVLTGYLDDGSAGLAAIKARGGIAVVQDPNDAAIPNMPRSALKHVMVDYCVPLSEISPLLIELVSRKGIRRGKRK